MRETKNLEKILEELEYLNTSVLKKLENLEMNGTIEKLEKLLKKLENARETLDVLERLNLISRTIFYAILADTNLTKKTIKVAATFKDDEVVKFLDKRSLK